MVDRLRAAPRRGIAAIAAIVAALATLAFLAASGGIDGTQASLVEMGFDPDRAALITALVVGLLAGGIAALVAGTRLVPGIAGLGVATFLYAPVFASETANALHAPADQGSFSTGGWVLTLVTLVTSAVVVGWAGPTLATDIRRSLVKALAALTDAIASRRAGRSLWRPAGAIAIVFALVFALPSLGTLLNYTPDTLMLSGHGQGVAAGGLPTSGPHAGGATASPGSSASAPTQALLASHPWTADPATGAGRIVQLTFAAPWTGGTSKTAPVWVYLPPGYDSSPALHYDTMYVPLWGEPSWQNGIQFPAMLDALIASGRIAPTIVVFLTSQGGPYVDSECINSFDGRENFESFLVGTVVPAIDSGYRTIAQPSARTLMGFSQGGWCAAMLLMRHADVFHNGLIFSGYFQPAPRTGTTVNSWRPFGGLSALEAAYSPMLNAGKVPAAVAHQMDVILVGNERPAFYGPQMRQFGALLQRDGFGVTMMDTPEQHSWVEVRHNMPAALDALFARLVRAGVYRSVYS